MELDRVIVGKEIQLQQFLEEDVSEEYLSWLSNSFINKYLEVRFTRHDMVSAREYVKKCLESPDTLFLKINFGEEKMIGSCTVSHNPNHKTAEIGLMIGDQNFHNRGIGSEVVLLLRDYCCSSLAVRKVTAGLYSSNFGSLRAFLKNEFFLESTLKFQVLLDEKPEDVYRLAYFCPCLLKE